MGTLGGGGGGDTKCSSSKGPSGQIRSPQIVVPLGRPRKGHTTVGFLFFYFDLEFLKGVQSSMALTVKIYLITNSLRGRQVIMFPDL
jgi:hypothetical protein